LVDFPPFWYISSTKSGNPDRHTKPSAQLSANNLPFKLNFRRKSSFFTFLIAPKTIFQSRSAESAKQPDGQNSNSFSPVRFLVVDMVARFSLVQTYQNCKNITNEHKMYRMVIIYTKCQ
jgi:hypothetical protein